jgi:hypothetical protein
MARGTTACCWTSSSASCGSDASTRDGRIVVDRLDDLTRETAELEREREALEAFPP